MANLCKCGGTSKDPKIRCKDLSNTSLPLECKLEYFIKVDNWKKAEKIIHKKITDFGVERYDKREWFKCDPGKIKHIFDEYVEEDDEVDVKEGDKGCDKVKVNKVINYYCKLCNYNTIDSGNFTNHKKTLKHNNNIKLEKLNEEKEQNNKDKQIEELKIRLIEKNFVILEKDNLIKDKEIKYLLLEKENEKIKETNKMYREQILLDSKKIKIRKKY